MPALRTSSNDPPRADHDPPGEDVSRVSGRRITRSVLLLSTITLTASALNYASNLAFARALTPASYGDFSSLLALSVVLSIPFTAAQTRVASRVTAHTMRGDWERVQYVVRNGLAHLIVVAGAATLVYCAFIPLIRPLFHLQAIGPAIALAPLIFALFLLPVLQGVLQGLERWVALGLVGLAAAVGRLAFGLPWALAGGGAGGAIGGQAIGIFCCFVGLLWLLRHHVRRRGNAAAWAGVRRRPDIAGVTAGAAYVFFAVIANFDVVLAKVFLVPRLSGEYAALSTIGNIVVYLPAAVALIVVPNAIKAGSSREDRIRVLRVCALLVAVGGLIAIIPAAVVPSFVLRTMFGTRYLAGSAGVLPIVCAGGGLALLNLLVTYTVAIEDTRWTWMLGIGMVLQFVLIALFHHSVTEVAVVQAITVGLLLVVNELWFHAFLPWPRRA